LNGLVAKGLCCKVHTELRTVKLGLAVLVNREVQMGAASGFRRKGLTLLALLAMLHLSGHRGWAEQFVPGEQSTGVLPIELIEGEAEFTISADPTVVVLQLHWSGGLRMDTHTYSLFGNGRLRSVNRSGGRVRERHEFALSFEQARALLSIAVQGGLMEWNWERIERKFVKAAGHEPSWTDARILRVRVALESYSRWPDRKAPIRKGFTTVNPALLRSEAPTVRELAALDELIQALEELVKRSREGS